MELEIFIGVQHRKKALLRFARMKLRKKFSQYKDRVKKVHVSMKDVNGPRGGIDKICKIVLTLKNNKTLVITGKGKATGDTFRNTVKKSLNSLRNHTNTKHFKPWKELQIAS